MNDKSCQKVFDCISLSLVSGFVAFVILMLVWGAMTIRKEFYGPNQPGFFDKDGWFIK